MTFIADCLCSCYLCGCGGTMQCVAACGGFFSLATTESELQRNGVRNKRCYHYV